MTSFIDDPFVDLEVYHTTVTTHQKGCTYGTLLFVKVHKTKGRTLFVVYVKPSKNKLDHLQNKLHLFTCIYCFLSIPAFQ